MDQYRLNRLLTAEEITSIVKNLADQISRDYVGKELILVCILKGAFMFLSDLDPPSRDPCENRFCAIGQLRIRNEDFRKN